MDAAISVQSLEKIYGKKEDRLVALDNINLSIKPGESIAIVGKSGSGKSTLMHILALLDEPTKGVVTVDGVDVSTQSEKQLDLLRNKKFGFVFQQFFLNGNETVLDNVILPLKIAKVSRKERHKRGLEVLKSVELEDKANSKALNLSGGQKQRVCIARALINNPDVIFADEPTGNLDSHMTVEVMSLFQELNDQGITVVIVTHEPDVARYAKRIVEVRDGRILKDHPVEGRRSAAADLAVLGNDVIDAPGEPSIA